METSAERRKRLDRERYLRNRAERLEKQREYYAANRLYILAQKKFSGFLKYGCLKESFADGQ